MFFLHSSRLTGRAITFKSREKRRKTTAQLAPHCHRGAYHGEQGDYSSQQLRSQHRSQRSERYERILFVSVDQRHHTEEETQWTGNIVQQFYVNWLEEAPQLGRPEGRRAIDDTNNDENIWSKACVRWKRFNFRFVRSFVRLRLPSWACVDLRMTPRKLYRTMFPAKAIVHPIACKTQWMWFRVRLSCMSDQEFRLYSAINDSHIRTLYCSYKSCKM